MTDRDADPHLDYLNDWLDRMNRRLGWAAAISTILLIVVAMLWASDASAWDLNQLNKRADENLVQVGDGCSGTLVDVPHRLILTAYHCIPSAVSTDDKPKLDPDGDPILGPDGKPIMDRGKKLDQVRVSQFFWDKAGKKAQVDYWTDIVARNQILDVAILKIPEKVGPLALNILATESVPLAAKDYTPQRGSAVWHIGNPLMLYGTVTKGIVSGARNLSDYGFPAGSPKFYVQYDGGLTGGSSGGALYDDNGQFIGITTMVVPSATFIGLAVPMSDVWTVAADACIAVDLGGENAPKCPNATKKIATVTP